MEQEFTCPRSFRWKFQAGIFRDENLFSKEGGGLEGGERGSLETVRSLETKFFNQIYYESKFFFLGTEANGGVYTPALFRPLYRALAVNFFKCLVNVYTRSTESHIDSITFQKRYKITNWSQML